jgi:hypothetical protein
VGNRSRRSLTTWSNGSGDSGGLDSQVRAGVSAAGWLAANPHGRPGPRCLTELLGDQRTGDTTTDLVNAARKALRRREINTAAGGSIIASLVTDQGYTYDQIAESTGIPRATAQRWAAPVERHPTGD